MKIIKFVDLFCGIGGARIGFEKACEGLYTPECVYSCDIKKHAIKTYNLNFNENLQVTDITKVNVEELPAFDVLLAGFPCQPFSTAGLKLGFEDAGRGNMFVEILKFINFHKPKFFVLENVDGILSHNNGETLREIIKAIELLKYKVNIQTLDASNFGVAQIRKRTFFVGLQQKSNVDLDFSKLNMKEKQVLNDILDKSDVHCNVPSEFVNAIMKLECNVEGKCFKDKRGGKNNIHSWDLSIHGIIDDIDKDIMNNLLLQRRKRGWAIKKKMKWMDGIPLTLDDIYSFTTNIQKKELELRLENLVKMRYLVKERPKDWDTTIKKRVSSDTLPEGYNINKGKLSYPLSKILCLDEPIPTLTATDGSRLGVKFDNVIRRLNSMELKRLCGFPEKYDTSLLSTNQMFDVFGNMICPPVIESIIELVLKNYEQL